MSPPQESLSLPPDCIILQYEIYSFPWQHALQFTIFHFKKKNLSLISLSASRKYM